MYSSTGILRYFQDPHKLIVEVDPGIAQFYRSMIPKWITLNPQKYPPHISVVRKEIPPNLTIWGKYEGEEISFDYTNEIFHGRVYYWLNAYCTRLEQIRAELGLVESTEYTRPPDGRKCFHITLGNMKPL